MRDVRLFSGFLLMVAVLAGCQQSPSLVQREGYYTWVDEQGQVRTSRVPVTQAEPGTQAEPVKAPSPANEQSLKPGGEASEPSRETARPSDEEYNLTNYPDAEALEAAGYVRPGDPLPYFTWRDADGQLRVSYYRPDTRSDVEKGLVPPPLSLTPGTVHLAKPSQPDEGNGESGSATTPDAFLVLGIDSSGPGFFQRWQQSCCRSMPVDEAISWSNSREFEVVLPAGAREFSFESGPSPYRLVRLPEATESASLVLRLRSFNNDGLFVPSVAFLNESLEPERLVTDLVMEYTPESWHRQGYLEAMIPAFPSQGERWLLIYTTRSDLDGQTVVETNRGPRAIPHLRRGLLSITEMDAR